MCSFRHAGIYVKNLEQMKTFYMEMFQLEEASAEIESGSYIESLLGLRGGVIAVSKLRFRNGGVLELIQVKEPLIQKEASRGELWRVGQGHIAVGVDNAEMVYRKLLERRLKTLSKPVVSANGYAKLFFCQDPEGNYLEVVEVL